MGAKKILIVDDEKYVREMIQLRLQEEGYDVSIASDAIEGINIAKTYQPDLILTDIMMEGISGIEGVKKLREEVSATVPILVLSGMTLDQDKQKAIEAGANGFVSKPILPARLIHEIQKYVKP